MKLLNTNEKKLLIIYISLAIMTLFFCLISNEKTHKENYFENKRIYIIHTSGQIEPEFQKEYEKNIGHIDIDTYTPLINGSHITPNDWNKIAKNIGNLYNDYDGFIIIHDNDTIAYTASAMSFMIENLNKPIIFTDKNLLLALLYISKVDFPEVMILSNEKLYRASTYSSSILIPLTKENTTFNNPQESAKIYFMNPKVKILVVKVFPGIDSKFLANVSKQSMHGLILELYNDGSSPFTDEILEIIAGIINKGVIIIGVSQKIDDNKKNKLNYFYTGIIFIPGMTTETAYTKLMYLLSNVKDKNIIDQLMTTSLRSEII